VRRFFLRLRNVVRPADAEPELARELASHLTLLEDDFERRGMTPEEARLAARRAFGGVEQAKERQRDARSFAWLDDLRWDLAYSVRSLRKTPGFTAIVVLTLALGIGATTAIFSVVHAVLMNPLPFERSEQLVRLWEHVAAAETPNGMARRVDGLEVRELLDLRARSRALSHVAAYGFALVTIPGTADSARLALAPVSAAAFPMLGVQPRLGRWFAPADEQSGERIIILSDRAWLRYFSRDPHVLGKTIRFNGNRFSSGVVLGADYAIVGVMPAGFHFPNEDTQFWIPLRLAPPANGRPRIMQMIARLADGASPDDAAAEVGAIVGRTGRRRFEVVRLQDELVAPVRSALLVLTAAVGLTFLIACGNVANLLLMRTAARRHEIGVRTALGAGRGRLIRQALTESALLAMLGGVAGTAFAAAGVRLFRLLATNMPRVDLGYGAAFPRLDAIEIDAPVLAFALAVSAVTGLAFGLAPAVRQSRTADVEVLRGATGTSRRGFGGVVTGQGVLVSVEIALATVLFIGGGLMMRGFVQLARVDPGYTVTNVLTFQVSLPGAERPPAQLRMLAEDLVTRLRSVHGVAAAAYGNQLPMVKLRDTAGGLWRTADPARPPTPSGPDARLVSRDYLDVMGIRVVAGRGFGENDRAGQPRVLLINQALARADLFSGPKLGQTVYIGRDPAPWQIVGIVEDVRQFGLDRDPEPQFFADVRQWSDTGPLFPAGAYYVVRTAANPLAIITDLRAIVQQMNGQAALDNVATMEQVVSNSLNRPRLYAVLLGIFAGVAVSLAAAGIYGVMAYSVTQRTREIGIRMALGARRLEVLRLVMRQSAVLTVVGLLVGLGGAIATTRYLESLLFGVTPLDPATFVAVPVMFASVAALASFIPARRATKVDPLLALRCE
jgi:putative ABC transport system permease protein